MSCYCYFSRIVFLEGLTVKFIKGFKQKLNIQLIECKKLHLHCADVSFHRGIKLISTLGKTILSKNFHSMGKKKTLIQTNLLKRFKDQKDTVCY